ncbi:Extracellular exo-alpha-(1-_5)-L-arabinofuranosidase precursor [Aquisphaera giovannonii]|uniref:Extracellular exo-alpha-(1->5)-L-arabinofuranosidase n=1 Tax=Aquisphaera giovannonii TaxID=406548 RepID=A0A5B9WBV8_9BACT|nr:family 43 glycosylhydrolase [Aquisphaera giovannonii]QEH37709.1 Extracellular exo-alpha-(1->5)-L-arabinofuranosidase precursor [Aquisphaera giovannonii]
MASRRAQGLFVLLLLLASATGVAAAGEVGDFYNIIAPDGADPWVYRHADGWYYATHSTGDGVVIRRSRTISGLGGAESRVAWRPRRGTPYSRDVWAPEIHFLRGKWYIYVAADDGENAHHRMVVLENPSADPFRGEFTLRGKLADGSTDRWAIDASILRLGAGDAERLYFLWSGWDGDVNVDQRLYIAPMSDPTTISGPRVELSRPTLDWEKAAGPPAINEGPVAIVREGRVCLIYSAAGSWSDHYCLGLLTLKPGADPLDPGAWTKSPRPVFEGTRDVVSPGHCCFTTSADGKEDWMVFHAAKRPGSGWSRSIRAQPFRWGADGLPDFGRPASPDRPIPLPSGEPRRLRLEAEAARPAGGAHAEPEAACSGGARVVGLRGEGGRLTFEATVAQAGSYVAAVRYRLPAPARRSARHRVLVDGRPAGLLVYPDSGGSRWSAAFARLPLRAGTNRVSLAAGEREVEVDCLDVVLDPEPAAADQPNAQNPGVINSARLPSGSRK